MKPSPDLLLPNKYNSSFSLNYRDSKMYANLVTTISMFSYSPNDRTNMLTDGITVLTQDNDGNRLWGFSGRTGVDFYLEKQNTPVAIRQYPKQKPQTAMRRCFTSSQMKKEFAEDYRYSTSLDESNSWYSYGSLGKALQRGRPQADGFGQRGYQIGFEEINFYQENFDGNDAALPGLNEEDSKSNVATIQLDYVRPMKKGYEMEWEQKHHPHAWQRFSGF
ncbi:MAG: hypothetical protein R3B47_15380 [Bacteroidia bacterium]